MIIFFFLLEICNIFFFVNKIDLICLLACEMYTVGSNLMKFCGALEEALNYMEHSKSTPKNVLSLFN